MSILNYSYNDLYSFTYTYGNGDEYYGYLYDTAGSYYQGQIVGYYSNDTGNSGYYTIDSVESVPYGYEGEVTVTSYYDGETGYLATSDYGEVDGYSSLGLGTEEGSVYSDYFSSASEADLVASDLYYFTYNYGNGDSYSGFGYAASGTYVPGQTLDNYVNDTGNIGFYTIDSVEIGYGSEGEVYVTSYYDGETGYLAELYYDDVYGSSTLGLGTEAGYLYSDYFSSASEADLVASDLYYFTYNYGNGDSYSGYGYAASGTYVAGQTLDNYVNDTGNLGFYTIDSVESVYGYVYEGEVYVTSYYDGETGYLADWYYDDVYGSSTLGLGTEEGYLYSDYFSSASEADLVAKDLYYFTYNYGNGDSYSGYGYAASGTYYIGQVLDNYSNETGNYGSYTINSVQTTYDGYGIEGEVYVTSYYNGETDYLASWDYDDINAYSNLGLGYEYGYFYSDYFSNYDEADLVITNATTLTLPSIFVSPKGGDIVGEGETQVFEIKLSNPYDQQILIQYKVKDWTASTDFYYGDFDGFSASFLTFDPGELVKEVYISIKDDLTDEDEEKYIFELYSASEGTYLLIPEEIQVVGRITDNDDSPSSLNITSLNPLGTPENPIIIPVDNSDITWIDIDFSYDNQSNEFIWIFSDGTGSTYSLGSSTYDTDNNDETNLGLLPKSGFNQQRISRGEPGEITAVSLFMQQQLVNGGYGNVLKEVTLPVNYIFVDDIDLAVTKLPIMNSLAEAGEEFTYTITISNDYSFYPGKIFLTEILPKGVIFVNSDIGPVYLEKDGDKTHLTFAFDNYSLSGSLIGTITVIPSKESRPIDNDFSQSGWTIETETHLRSGEIYINDPDLSNNSIIQEIQVFDPDFINDDTTSLPSITLSVSPASVLENGTSNLVYTFTRTGATTNALTVNYSVAGTADNTDYTGTTTGTGKTVTFAAGSATAIVTIDPTADTRVEPDETVVLTLASGTGYTIATPDPITGAIINVGGQQNWSLDVDGNGTVGALSDGIMAVRYMFGAAFAGDALINGAIAPNATRNLSQIQAYLQEGVTQKFLDIDGNGSVGALSDGIMAVRYMFGAAFSGNALINGAIAPDATRDLAGIQNYLADLTTIV